nr:hypothetical protein GCM10020093_014060 [Planobispora longispora]
MRRARACRTVTVTPTERPVRVRCPRRFPLSRDRAALLDAMLGDLEELVVCESFSADLDAVARSAGVVAAQGTRLLGVPPETIVIDGVTHLRWTFGTPVCSSSATTTRSGRSAPCGPAPGR